MHKKMLIDKICNLVQCVNENEKEIWWPTSTCCSPKLSQCSSFFNGENEFEDCVYNCPKGNKLSYKLPLSILIYLLSYATKYFLIELLHFPGKRNKNVSKVYMQTERIVGTHN